MGDKKQFKYYFKMKPKSKYLQHLNSATFTSFIIVSEKVKAKSEKKGNGECIKPWYYFKSRKILARTTVLNQSKTTLMLVDICISKILKFFI